MGSQLRPGVGTILATHYLLVEPLGWDAWGERFLALHQRSGQYHDLWLGLPPSAAPSRPARYHAPWGGDLFAAQCVKHPGIPGIRLLGRHEENFILARQALPRCLAERGKPQPLPAALAAMLDVADALGACHAQGLHHGAVSPLTIALNSDDEPRLVDFRAGSIRGEPVYREVRESVRIDPMPLQQIAYLAPEVIAGKAHEETGPEALERRDVYGLALSLLSALLGRNPFATENTVATLVAAVRGIEGIDAVLLERQPAALVELLRGALAARPGERPSLEALRRGIVAIGITAGRAAP